MTYLPTKRPRKRMTKPQTRQAMGGLLDFLFGAATPGAEIAQAIEDDASTQVACTLQADTQTANLDALMQQIATTWNPVGNYAPGDMNKASAAVYGMLEQAKVAVINSPNTTGDAPDMISQALDDITKYENRGIQYQQAIAQAMAAGTQVIAAPQFKDWVTASLVAASGAFATRAVLDCNVTYLDTAYSYMQQVWGVVQTIADVVVNAASTVLNVVDNTAKIADFLSSNLIPIAVVGGLALIYFKFYKK